jgi:hypothetical protein
MLDVVTGLGVFCAGVAELLVVARDEPVLADVSRIVIRLEMAEESTSEVLDETAVKLERSITKVLVWTEGSWKPGAALIDDGRGIVDVSGGIGSSVLSVNPGADTVGVGRSPVLVRVNFDMEVVDSLVGIRVEEFEYERTEDWEESGLTAGVWVDITVGAVDTAREEDEGVTLGVWEAWVVFCGAWEISLKAVFVRVLLAVSKLLSSEGEVKDPEVGNVDGGREIGSALMVIIISVGWFVLTPTVVGVTMVWIGELVVLLDPLDIVREEAAEVFEPWLEALVVDNVLNVFELSEVLDVLKTLEVAPVLMTLDVCSAVDVLDVLDVLEVLEVLKSLELLELVNPVEMFGVGKVVEALGSALGRPASGVRIGPAAPGIIELVVPSDLVGDIVGCGNTVEMSIGVITKSLAKLPCVSRVNSTDWAILLYVDQILSKRTSRTENCKEQSAR